MWVKPANMVCWRPTHAEFSVCERLFFPALEFPLCSPWLCALVVHPPSTDLLLVSCLYLRLMSLWSLTGRKCSVTFHSQQCGAGWVVQGSHGAALQKMPPSSRCPAPLCSSISLLLNHIDRLSLLILNVYECLNLIILLKIMFELCVHT